jgi:hypothetical protein
VRSDRVATYAVAVERPQGKDDAGKHRREPTGP